MIFMTTNWSTKRQYVYNKQVIFRQGGMQQVFSGQVKKTIKTKFKREMIIRCPGFSLSSLEHSGFRIKCTVQASTLSSIHFVRQISVVMF